MSAIRTVLGRAIGLVWLVIWSTYAVAAASVLVARDIVAPSARLVPGVLVVPLRSRTAVEVASLSALITLTPGTLVVRIDPDRRDLWVHTMYAADPEAARREIVALETRVLRTLRYPARVEAT